MSNISVPTWPSLYNPGIEIINIEGKDPIQPGGHYLFRARDVFVFTLYWTLCLYTPAFIVCGCYAFWNLNFPPVRNHTTINSNNNKKSYDDHHHHHHHHDDAPTNEVYQLPTLTTTTTTTTFRCNNINHPPPPTPPSFKRKPKENERRSRLTFALLVLLTFLSISVAGAVIGSAVLGFTVFGLFRSGGFVMSTWIPFILALAHVLAGLLSIWPSIIDVI